MDMANRRRRKKRNFALESGARVRMTLDVTPRARELLRVEALRRKMTQLMLFELMVREYCTPPVNERQDEEDDRAEHLDREGQ
jgi:hypothetical protein